MTTLLSTPNLPCFSRHRRDNTCTWACISRRRLFPAPPLGAMCPRPKTFGSTPLRTKLSDLAKQVSLTGHRPHRRTNPPARATHRHCPPNPCVSTEQHLGIFAESYQTPNIASRRKLVRFIFEEMKGELLLCDEAWELENGPGNHLLLIDRCLKNQVPQAQQGSRGGERPARP